mmetsp:Transcript_5700/g.35485  ORF Transcript_5700/g.35485 Transcript_5700/m.35485 type:complete len:254 (+) Transcript_5700:3120-3881(+)
MNISPSSFFRGFLKHFHCLLLGSLQHILTWNQGGCDRGRRSTSGLLQHGGGVLCPVRIVEIVQVCAVIPAHFGPSLFSDVINTNRTTRDCIAESGVVDGSSSQFHCIFWREVPTIPFVQHTVGVQGSRPHAEHLAFGALSFAVYVVQAWSGSVPSGNHGAHGQPHSFVPVQGVGQEFGCSTHGDPPLVFQLVGFALHAQVTLPELAICRASRHCAQQVWIDLDHFLHRLRRCGANVLFIARTRCRCAGDLVST